MKNFHFTPNVASKESIDKFNARVCDFCREQSVVHIKATAAYDGIFLSVSTPEDVIAEPLVVMPIVVPIQDADFTKLESIANKFCNQVLDNDSEENPQVPAKAMVVMRTDRPAAGYLVVIVNIGELEADEEEESGE